MIQKAISSFLVVFGIAACEPSSGPTGTPPPRTPIAPDGFACTTSPSTAYAPGYIYRVDRDGVEWLSQDLSFSTRATEYPAALGGYEAVVTRGAGLTASLLSPVASISSGSMDGSISDVLTTKVAFESGAFLLLNDTQEDELIQFANENIRVREGSSYFVVRDVIQASGIRITLSNNDVVRLGGSASLIGLIEASPTFSVARDETLTIEGDFNDRLNVCIRAVPLSRSVPTTQDGEPVVVSESTWQLHNAVAPLPVSEQLLRLR